MSAVVSPFLDPASASSAPFRVSPSMLARYFFHNCERFLRYSATPKEQRAAQAVPLVERDQSPILEAIFKHGTDWEERVIRTHAPLMSLPPGTAPLPERRHGLEETLHLLRTERPGRYIYQAMLRPPMRFYDSHGLDPALVTFSDNYPDLI